MVTNYATDARSARFTVGDFAVGVVAAWNRPRCRKTAADAEYTASGANNHRKQIQPCRKSLVCRAAQDLPGRTKPLAERASSHRGHDGAWICRTQNHPSGRISHDRN